MGLDFNQTIIQLLMARRRQFEGMKRKVDGFRIDGFDDEVAFIERIVA